LKESELGNLGLLCLLDYSKLQQLYDSCVKLSQLIWFSGWSSMLDKSVHISCRASTTNMNLSWWFQS